MSNPRCREQEGLVSAVCGALIGVLAGEALEGLQLSGTSQSMPSPLECRPAPRLLLVWCADLVAKLTRPSESRAVLLGSAKYVPYSAPERAPRSTSVANSSMAGSAGIPIGHVGEEPRSVLSDVSKVTRQSTRFAELFSVDRAFDVDHQLLGIHGVREDAAKSVIPANRNAQEGWFLGWLGGLGRDCSGCRAG